MRKIFRDKVFLLFFLLWICQPLNANNVDVANWTEKVLLQTLSVSTDDNRKSNIKEIRSFYTYNAWQALQQFFNNELSQIKNEKLSTHPYPMGSPKVLGSGTVENSNFFKGIQYWMVKQVFKVPEFDMTLTFTVLVVAQPKKGLEIGSVNIEKNQPSK